MSMMYIPTCPKLERNTMKYLPLLLIALLYSILSAQEQAEYIRENYTKYEYRVPMRDGAKLFTAVYIPNDVSQNYPILMYRTPYSVRPYGADQYRKRLGPNHLLAKDGYIFVYQDVRGTMMSEGEFVNMTPHVSAKKINESTDTYDTIEWLLKNIKHHNGKVGQWGISYPGFYSAAGMIDSHPALKAVSPQAPIADWFWDDFHHHGAFFLPHGFNFLSTFGKKREKLRTTFGERFDHKTPDGYQFFLDMGPLKNANEKYLHGKIKFWNDIVEHPNYDEFWQSRNILPHLKNVKCAVMTVGGWFDAEDLYGPLNIYKEVEKNNPGIFNMLVMGPWVHGGWARGEGDSLGDISFGAKTSNYYQKHVELMFFNHFLKDKGDLQLPEALCFETGANRWRRFSNWPPDNLQQKNLYTHEKSRLDFSAPQKDGFDDYISDPNKPVPSGNEIAIGMTREYMIEDQRFAARRPDVLHYQTSILEEDMTVIGPIHANLWVSTTGSSADWVVKIIDVFPNDYEQAGKKEGETKKWVATR